MHINILYIFPYIFRPLSLVGSLYGVLVVLTGLMFSATEALTQTWLKTLYNGVSILKIILFSKGCFL